MIRFRLVAFGTPEYAPVLDLRERILRKPLGLTFPADLDETDHLHIVGFEGDQPVAVALLKPRLDGEVQMRQVAVEESQQGTGLGRKLVEAFEQTARDHGAKNIMLHARANVVPFYEKLGYHVEGEPFEEVGIPHRLMRKTL